MQVKSKRNSQLRKQIPVTAQSSDHARWTHPATAAQHCVLLTI